MGKHRKKKNTQVPTGTNLPPLAPPYSSGDSPEARASQFDAYNDRLVRHREAEISKIKDPTSREFAKKYRIEGYN